MTMMIITCINVIIND